MDQEQWEYIITISISHLKVWLLFFSDQAGKIFSCNLLSLRRASINPEGQLNWFDLGYSSQQSLVRVLSESPTQDKILRPSWYTCQQGITCPPVISQDEHIYRTLVQTLKIIKKINKRASINLSTNTTQLAIGPFYQGKILNKNTFLFFLKYDSYYNLNSHTCLF